MARHGESELIDNFIIELQPYLALIDQAVGILLDSYVDQLPSNDLFQAAYDGTVATLRASGSDSADGPT